MCSTYDDYASLEKDVCDRVVYQCAVTKELADQLVPALPYEELLAYCRIQNYLVLRFEVQGIWYVKVISNYVEIKEIVVYMAENSQAMAKICIYYDEVNVKTDEITLSEVKYLDNNFADKYGLSLYHDEEAWDFFTKWMEWQYQIADQNKHFIYNKIGWQENGKISPFVLDQGYATVNGQIMECANMSCATPAAFTAVGSCSDWLKGVQKHVLGHQMLEIALAISLAAPLFPLVNPILSPIWCFVGNSTTGKTTALKLALSVWCSPAKADGSLYHTWNQTDNAALDLVKLYCGLPIGLDDTSASKLDKAACGKLFYALAEGSSKSRSSADGTLQPTTTSFNTFILTAEESMLDQNGYEGLLKRYFELYDKVTDSSEHAHSVEEIYTKNHGVFGRKYIQLLLKRGESKIRKDHEEAVMQLKSDTADLMDDRIVRTWAVLLQALRYLSIFKVNNEKIGLDLERITNYMRDKIFQVQESYFTRTPEDAFLSALIDFVEDKKKKAYYGINSNWGGQITDPNNQELIVYLIPDAVEDVYKSIKRKKSSLIELHRKLYQRNILEGTVEGAKTRYNVKKKKYFDGKKRVYVYHITRELYEKLYDFGPSILKDNVMVYSKGKVH